MIAISERKRAHYIYKENKKVVKHFYIQKARHFEKFKTISVIFLLKKARHLTLLEFS